MMIAKQSNIGSLSSSRLPVCGIVIVVAVVVVVVVGTKYYRY